MKIACTIHEASKSNHKINEYLNGDTYSYTYLN